MSNQNSQGRENQQININNIQRRENQQIQQIPQQNIPPPQQLNINNSERRENQQIVQQIRPPQQQIQNAQQIKQQRNPQVIQFYAQNFFNQEKVFKQFLKRIYPLVNQQNISKKIQAYLKDPQSISYQAKLDELNEKKGDLEELEKKMDNFINNFNNEQKKQIILQDCMNKLKQIIKQDKKDEKLQNIKMRDMITAKYEQYQGILRSIKNIEIKSKKIRPNLDFIKEFESCIQSKKQAQEKFHVSNQERQKYLKQIHQIEIIIAHNQKKILEAQGRLRIFQQRLHTQPYILVNQPIKQSQKDKIQTFHVKKNNSFKQSWIFFVFILMGAMVHYCFAVF